MKIINNNPRFGAEGTYEAESFEALADEMGPTLVVWATENFMNDVGTFDDVEYVEFMKGRTHKEVADSYCDDIRKEFIRGLEEVSEEQMK